MAGSATRGTGLKIWRKLGVVCAVVLLVTWGCTVALRSVDDFLSLGGEGQSVDFEFVDRTAPSPGQEPELPPGDVILASRTDYGDDYAITDQGTWAIPLSGRETGEPVQVLDANAQTVSPGGTYVVGYDDTTRKQEIIRLLDRTVVGTISAPGFVFLDDHRIVAFGSEDDYRFGEAKEIDLGARTIRDIEVRGLTMSVSPSFVVDGEIGLCEEQELDAGSGPSCVSTRLLDPATGETRALPEHPEPTISADGEYLFTDPWAWASRQVGDEVVYWLDNDEATDHMGRFDPLRAGSLSGPSPEDRESAVPVHLVDVIFKTSDDRWVLIDATPKSGGGGISVCDVATLDCSVLPWTSQPPYTAPEWTMIGVLPASAVADP
jgi:hypothetical protein